jgi:hypothetical protein
MIYDIVSELSRNKLLENFEKQKSLTYHLNPKCNHVLSLLHRHRLIPTEKKKIVISFH